MFSSTESQVLTHENQSLQGVRSLVSLRFVSSPPAPVEP